MQSLLQLLNSALYINECAWLCLQKLLQKQVASGIWPVSHSLPTCILDYFIFSTDVIRALSPLSFYPVSEFKVISILT